MGRWEGGAADRLRLAAFELYTERGYEQTTVADIAARAGLTERTFFRHFTDKREVLFSGSAELQQLFVSSVTDAPAAASPMDAVTLALEAAAGLMQPRREFSLVRQAIISANTPLQEREHIKLATLAVAVANALRARGVGDPTADLTAQAGIAVFHVSFARWIDPTNTRDFAELMHDSLAELRSVTA